MLKSAPSSVIDPGILVHQIPGGMISNFRSQLEQQGALDKLDQALEEVTKVRQDLGYPPLVDAHLPDRGHPGRDERAGR